MLRFCFVLFEDEEWDSSDERKLDLLQKLNAKGAYGIPGAKIDYDIQLELEAKKKRCEEKKKEKEEDFNKT